MIELLPAESSAWSAAQSHRISFSHDFPNSGDGIPVDGRPLLDSASDFHFFSGEPSLADDSYSRSADELFSNGRILPATLHRTKPPAPPPPAPARETLRDLMRTPELGSDDSSLKPPPPPPPGSSSKAAFWRFGRRSSLNSYGRSKRSLLGKLLPLSRSNCTGSSNQTQKKDHNKSTTKPKRLPPPPSPSSSSSSSSVSSLPKQLPRAKKAGAGFAGGRVNPVLNVPPPYISASTTNLFGCGYIFRQSRECTSTSSKSTKKTTT